MTFYVFITWLLFWFSVMAIPNYLFKKYNFTYYQNPTTNSIFYILSIIVIGLVYKNSFIQYSANFSNTHILILLVLFLSWILVPKLYKNDYYTKQERCNYQIPKFFEILYQQVCFLAGVLTFGVSPLIFGIIFFIVHIPSALFIPRKFAFFFTSASLVGGIVFASFQSLGIFGFLISFATHLLFYIAFHFALSRKAFLGDVPHKR